MSHIEKFEDDGFFYTLNIEATKDNEEKLYVDSQGRGFRCDWEIRSKKSSVRHEVRVTNDDCDVVVYPTVEAARLAARHFISAPLN